MTVLGDVSDLPGDRLTDRIGLGVLTQLLNRDLVDEVLASTGKVEQRKRLLPARVVVYYVCALTLFFDDAYEEVLRKLINGLRFVRSWQREWSLPTTGAISQARIRLGSEPMQALFERVAVPLAEPGRTGCWYQGLRVMAVDGMVLDTADTPENDAVFGKKGHRSGESAFPQVRVLSLCECGTHATVAAVLDSWRVYERDLLLRLLDNIEPGTLLLADRGFYSYDMWVAASQTGAHLVWRIKNGVRLPILERYDDGSFRSELLPNKLKADLRRNMKRRVPEGARIPVRVVEYRIGNRPSPEVIRLVTTLVDDRMYPASEIAALYAQRWEIELGYNEAETHQMRGRHVLRSKKPDLVKQEIWGLLLTHYAVRKLMYDAADDIDIDPDRLSFLRSLRIVRRSVVNDGDFSP